MDVQMNSLAGVLPPNLCNGTDQQSNLTDLFLSSNQFEGVLQIPSCDGLIYLNLQVRFGPR